MRTIDIGYGRYRRVSIKKDDADDDARVRNEKAEETKIGKSELQIRREDGLQRSTDSPEIGDFEPALASGPHRHDHYDHSPIAQLQRQAFVAS